MYVEDFTAMLAENGIDESHPQFDELMADFMFGGADPNEIVERIHQEVNLKLDFGPENRPEITPDEWTLRGDKE